MKFPSTYKFDHGNQGISLRLKLFVEVDVISLLKLFAKFFICLFNNLSFNDYGLEYMMYNVVKRVFAYCD